ncbi:OsmC family protein [Gracilibacillus sp. Marseille-QA3620]
MKFTINNEIMSADLGYGELLISPNNQKGYRPIELFVSSLAGCSGTVLRDILQKKRLGVRQVDIEVSVSRIPEEANRINQLCFFATVHADKTLSPESTEKVTKLMMKNCGMIQSVISSIDINYEVIFAGDK